MFILRFVLPILKVTKRHNSHLNEVVYFNNMTLSLMMKKHKHNKNVIALHSF
jgi:hypothetical protein